MAFTIGNTFCRLCQLGEERLKEELAACVRGLFAKGLVSSGGGNHSARMPGANEVWITPSGYPRSHTRPENLVKIDLDGNVLEGTLRPSIEVPFHTEIYRRRPDVNAVVHAHSPYTQGVSLSGLLEGAERAQGRAVLHVFDRDPKIPLAHGEAALILGDIPILPLPEDLGDVPVVPYRNPGARELAKLVADAAVGEALRPIRIMVLLNHGVLGMGACIHEARAFVEIMEEWARFLTVSKIFGGPKHLIKPSDLQALGARYARAIKFGGRQAPVETKTS